MSILGKGTNDNTPCTHRWALITGGQQTVYNLVIYTVLFPWGFNWSWKSDNRTWPRGHTTRKYIGFSKFSNCPQTHWMCSKGHVKGFWPLDIWLPVSMPMWCCPMSPYWVENILENPSHKNSNFIWVTSSIAVAFRLTCLESKCLQGSIHTQKSWASKVRFQYHLFLLHLKCTKSLTRCLSKTEPKYQTKYRR